VPEYIRSARIPVCLLALFISIPLTAAAAGDDDKPNIVLVLTDNFGYGEVGVYGGGVLRGAATPNIDGITKTSSLRMIAIRPKADIELN
jgi:hypothetical protein